MYKKNSSKTLTQYSPCKCSLVASRAIWPPTIVVIIAWVFLFLTFTSTSSTAHANELQGRLGVGMSNQLQNDIPSISFKIHTSEQFAAGLLVGISTSDKKGGYGAGIKLYRILFVEPQLNFFSSALLGVINRKTTSTSDTGFQFDATLGTEFHFTGLQSVGFSFEFGISVNKIKDDFNIQTTGHNLFAAGVHFYI